VWDLLLSAIHLSFDAMMMIPRGKYLGERVADPPEREAEHFVRCPACDGWIDCRD
jgi:hypothetical protein